MWLNPNRRGSRLRIWQPWGCNSLHAHQLTATGFSGNSRPRRLKIAEPSGCKSRVADRRVVNREQQTGSTQDRTALGVQVSPRRPIWNVNRASEPDLFAKQWAPGKGSVVRVHGIPPPSEGRSEKAECRMGLHGGRVLASDPYRDNGQQDIPWNSFDSGRFSLFSKSRMARRRAGNAPESVLRSPSWRFLVPGTRLFR
jgi:hypothetical protein